MHCDGAPRKSDFSLRRRQRIRRAEDFLSLKRKGKRIGSNNFTLIYMPNNLGWNRLGILVRKRICTAVGRNRIKRLVREFFRINKAELSSGYDILVIPKRDISSFNYREMEAELFQLIAGRLNG